MEADMRLTEVTSDNMDKILKLKVEEGQERYVPSAAGIIARAWAYRKQGAVCV